MLAAIALGANLNSPEATIAQAIQYLKRLRVTKLVACSSLYYSRPQGPGIQPDYVNMMVLVRTTLAPQVLLSCLQDIEKRLGRSRGVRPGLRWGPRAIDLDIIVYGNKVINTKQLSIPHKQAHKRSFVLHPLAEIGAQLAIPGKGTVSELLAQVEDNLVYRKARFKVQRRARRSSPNFYGPPLYLRGSSPSFYGCSRERS